MTGSTTLMEAVARHLRDLVRKQGWAYLKDVPLLDADELAASIGQVLRISNGDSSKILKPYSIGQAPPGSMSSMTGTGSQPMHTDKANSIIPPRFLLFTCIDPGESQCPTEIWSIDLDTIVHISSPTLFRSGWKANGGRRRRAFYCQVVNQLNEQRFVRFDPCCMIPPSGDNSLIEEVYSSLKKECNKTQIFWVGHDILLLDNWRCLHGRGEATESPSRRLRRWLIGGDGGLDTRGVVRQS